MPPKKKSARAKPHRIGTKSSLREEIEAALSSLQRLGSQRVREDMSKRYGIHLPDPDKAFGVPVGKIQQVAKRLKANGDAARNHELAAALWETGWYEARMLAAFVDEAELVTAAQMDRWCRDFDNWGICDTVCFKLFDRVDPPDHALPFDKARKWATSPKEFVKRAGFALMACLALHCKKPDALAPALSQREREFLRLLPLIERGAADERNFVKKGVSWALRAIGGRGPKLKVAARALAQRLAESEQPGCRWVGKDALKDFTRP